MKSQEKRVKEGGPRREGIKVDTSIRKRKKKLMANVEVSLPQHFYNAKFRYFFKVMHTKHA
jgi:hypothetical protein